MAITALKEVRESWRGIGLIAVTTLGTIGLLGWRLNTLPGGVAIRELEHAPETITASGLVEHTAYFPLMLVRYVGHFLPQNLVTLRAGNVLFGLLTLLTVTYILRRWYGVRTAIIGTILFACSSWFLHVSRVATFDVMYLWALPTLLASHIILYHHNEKARAIFVWLAVQIVLLYIPGMIWFVLAGIVIQRRDIAGVFETLKPWWRLALWVVMGLGLLAPLAYGLVFGATGQLALQLTGLPSVLPDVMTVVKGAVATLLFVFVRAPLDPTTWLGRLPALGAFMAAMFVAGVLFYLKHIRAERTQLLISYGVIGFVLTAIGGEVTRSILVPLLHLVAAAGIAFFLHEWFVVFPRNKWAKRVALLLMSVALLFSCLYNLRSYFVAWPHSTQTFQTFTKTYPDRTEL